MTLMPLKLISTRGDPNKLVMIPACFKLTSDELIGQFLEFRNYIHFTLQRAKSAYVFIYFILRKINWNYKFKSYHAMSCCASFCSNCFFTFMQGLCITIASKLGIALGLSSHLKTIIEPQFSIFVVFWEKIYFNGLFSLFIRAKNMPCRMVIARKVQTCTIVSMYKQDCMDLVCVTVSN